jgi:hypothetical protein
VSDLGSSNYSEAAASNNAMPPDGWPEGMAPSDVNNSAREIMAGTKRFWDRNNSTLTTGGTSTAYTLTYSVAAAAYYNGEEFAFYVNATCGATPTLNINSLGAQNIRKFSGGAWSTLAAGDIVSGQALRVAYNSSATTFDIVAQPPQSVWQTLGTATPSGVSTVDFTGIPTNINQLLLEFELRPGTNAVDLGLQVYGTGGTLDSGTNYAYAGNASTSNSTSGVGGNGANSSIVLNRSGNSISNNSSVGISGRIEFQNIQASAYTKCTFQSTYLDSGGSNLIANSGGGWHAVAANITGIRFLLSSGIFSGRITLLGSSN